MKNYHSLGVLEFLLCLLCVFIFSSCGSDLSERDFFLSQSRDPRLVGKWLLVCDSMDETPQIREYTTRGEIKETFNGRDVSFRCYYYTKGKVLYELTLGDGFKTNNRTRELEYHFSEDGNTLYFKEKGSSDKALSQWKRVGSTGKE